MASTEIYTVDSIQIVLRQEIENVNQIAEQIVKAKDGFREYKHVKEYVQIISVKDNNIFITLSEYQNRWALGGLVNDIRKLIDGESGMMSKKSKIKEIVFF